MVKDNKQLIKIIMVSINHWHIKQAVRHLKAGGLIAYPTEAVYGLGCDPLNETAVTRLLAVKQRDWQKGLILIAADYTQLSPFLEPLPPNLTEQILASWPGPVTWLLPAKPKVPHWLRGLSKQQAVRITAHPQAAALCQHWGGALISTSANRSGHSAAKTALKVRRCLGQTIDYIMPGQIGGQQRPSEIRDALTNKIIRA